MSSIIRGTTPTITYTFSTVDVDDIEKAYLTFKQDETTILEKDISTATTGSDNDLSWTLTQAETLTFKVGKAKCQLNWLLYEASGGTRGASNETKIDIDRNYKEEEI